MAVVSGAEVGLRAGPRFERVEERRKPGRSFYDLIRTDEVRNRTVLDVGCGSISGNGIVKKTGTYIGLDRSETELAEAKWFRPSLTLVRGNAEHLPFRDRSVDLVISGHMVTMLGRKAQEAIKEMVRVAREGVIFNVTHTDYYALNPILSSKREELEFGTLFMDRITTFDENEVCRALYYAGAVPTTVTTYFKDETGSEVGSMLLVRARRE